LSRFLLSRNQRYAVTCLFFLGYAIILILGPFQPSFVYQTIVVFVYWCVGIGILSTIFAGSIIEQAYTFPFSLDVVFSHVPKVFEPNRRLPYGRRRLYGKVEKVDQSSRSYVLRIGWRPWTSILTIDLSKVDDSTTTVRYDTSFFFGYEKPFRAGLDLFFLLLNTSLTT